MKFDDIPQVLVDAVTSAEDKRFFQHSGFDPLRASSKAVLRRSERRPQGAGRLHAEQQLARSFWLDNEKSWKRKPPEMMITIELEQKLSKKEIFEDYCNQMYLGRRGSFSIQGFGEAAQAYFGKDIRQLNVPEAATLAGDAAQRQLFTIRSASRTACASGATGAGPDAAERLHHGPRIRPGHRDAAEPGEEREHSRWTRRISWTW